MTKATLVRVFLCIFCAGVLLYAYIEQQNALTRLRLDIPVLSKEIRDLKETNTQLKYEIERFESPEHLLELSASRQFSHLKHPLLKDIIALPQGVALQISSEEKSKPSFTTSIFGTILPDFRSTFWGAYEN